MLRLAVKMFAITAVAVLLLGFTLSQTRAGASIVSQPQQYAVAAVSAPDNSDWIVTNYGAVISYGPTPSLGGMSGTNLNGNLIVGMASTTDDNGYWLVGSDGGVFAFGDAQFYGSLGGVKLNAPIVAIAPTGDGKGYWLLGADGGVFAFGDAQYLGRVYFLNAVGIATFGQGTTAGYIIATSDGETFTFLPGKVPVGTSPITPLNAPIVGIVVDNGTKDGFWLVGRDGGVFSIGAPFYGSLGGTPQPNPFVAIVAPQYGQCYSEFDNTSFIPDTSCDDSGQQVAPGV